MTDMSTHMPADQANVFADLGAMPAVDVTAKGRTLGIGFYLAVIWVVLIVAVAILAPWLPLKDPEKSYVVAGERPPSAPSGGRASRSPSDSWRSRSACSSVVRSA